jgi:hypothetical protein
MKHLIPFSYIQWLRKFSAHSQDSTVRTIVPILTFKLQTTESIQEIISLIQPHIDTGKTNIYGPVNFYSQLNTWQAVLHNIVNDSKRANQSFERIIKTEQNHLLLDLIHEFLKTPRNQMHNNTPSLLKILCDDEFHEVIQYIVSIQDAPAPINPPKGSFALVTPINEMHADGLRLLNNVCSKYEERSPIWHKANSLLQSLLLNYQDMQKVEIGLVETEEAGEPPKVEGSTWSSQCNLM